jgi:hypothetical protein
MVGHSATSLPDNAYELEPAPWLQGSLEGLRATLEADCADMPEFRDRVWARVVQHIEADEADGPTQVRPAASERENGAGRFSNQL